jgi:hypothetical protein
MEMSNDELREFVLAEIVSLRGRLDDVERHFGEHSDATCAAGLYLIAVELCSIGEQRIVDALAECVRERALGESPSEN